MDSTSQPVLPIPAIPAPEQPVPPQPSVDLSIEAFSAPANQQNLINSLDESAAPPLTPAKVDAPVAQAPVTPEIPQPPVAEIVPVEPPAPVALDPAAELVRLREMNEALVGQLNALAGGTSVIPAAQAPAETLPITPAAQVQQVVADALNFVDAESFDEVLRDPKKFNEVLHRIYIASQDAAMNKMVPLAVNIVQQEQALREVRSDFYAKNPDLIPFQPYMTSIINNIHSQKPTTGFKELMEEAGKEVRTRLKMAVESTPAVVPPVAQPAKPAAKRPPFAPGTGARQSASSLSGQAKHMADVDLG